MFVEVHHLESIELIGDSLNFFHFTWLDDLNLWIIPLDITSRSQLVLTTRFDGATGYLSIVNVFDPVMSGWTSEGLCAAHDVKPPRVEGSVSFFGF